MNDLINPYDYPNKSADKTARITFKCLYKPCGKFWTKDFVKRHEGWKLVGSGPLAYFRPTWKVVGYYPIGETCPFCGSNRVKQNVITGKINDTPCDGRCTSARGHNCECSCGGANHGIDHRIS